MTFLHDFQDYPEVFTDDDFLRPHKRAAELNFNFLIGTLATPEAGAHELVVQPDGQALYRTREEAVSYFPPPGFGGQDITVPVPMGKEYRSAFFADGTNFYLGNIGSFAEEELALEALLDPAYFWFPGRDTWGSTELWQTNYYNSFPYALLDALGSIVAGDTERITPRWRTGGVVYRDYADLDSTVEGTPVAPAIGFNLRIRALVYGVGLVYSGYSDRTLLDYARVWEVGSGEEVITDNPTLSFTDPRTGKQYAAISYLHEGHELGIGARLVTRGAQLAQGWADAEADGADEEVLDWYRRELRRVADLIDISRIVVMKFEEAGYDGP